MHAWAQFWLVVIIVGFSLFALVSLGVAVLGFKDVKKMFEEMRHEDRNAERSSPRDTNHE